MDTMDKMEINTGVKMVCESSSHIKNCMDDTKFLCQTLNNLDKNYIKSIYKSDKSGPILDLRKEVARTILLDELNEDSLDQIIESNKLKNPGKITINNPYRILNPIVNTIHSDSIDFVKKFGDIIKEKFGDCKIHIWDFSGARFQGQEWCCILLYNKELKSHSDGMQLWISFRDNLIEYGVTDYVNSKKENGEMIYLNPITPIKVSPDDFNLDHFYKFIDNNKHLILDEVIGKGMTFLDGAKFILSELMNKPMSANEIWDEISSRGLVKTSGKTPWATLNTLILNECVDTPNQTNKSRNIFKIVDKNPVKFILNNYMPDSIKETMIQNGFITIDILKDLFDKNGLKFEL